MEVEEIPMDAPADIIQPINQNTVHRICSGQVVLSLSIAVKELVENAIDAGAKNIDVRLRDYGMDSIEVCDNGTGVKNENFAALTLKHYTSKIRTFDDLESIGTLGFRGEALSSLCALSEVTILTRHESTEIGTKIEYDSNGKIKNVTPIARPVGTTVTLQNLFASLPVRRKEFVKNHKREFTKMCNLLYAYCLVSKGIKFKCSNTNTKGVNNVVMSTVGSDSLKDNIISIFTTKQLANLIEVEYSSPDESVAQEYGIKICPGDPSPFKFDFLISSVTHGCGRSVTDRQFYYINSRPCEPTKIMKLVNRIYRQFNSHQYPFVYLNVFIDSSYVDVNVTPDKRQIFLEKEKLLLAVIKMSLMEAFKNFPSTYKMQNLMGSNNGLKRENETSVLKQEIDISKLKEESNGNKRENGESGLNIFDSFRKKPKVETEKTEIEQTFMQKKIEILPIPTVTTAKQEKTQIENIKCTSNSPQTQQRELKAEDVLLHKEEFIACKLVGEPQDDSRIVITGSDQDEISLGLYRKHRKTISLSTNLEEIQKALKAKMNFEDKTKELKVKFRSGINPGKNDAAEKELEMQISKDKFKEMKIIGQFNYGFIIAQLDNDLFIIDQHASDEKYNFEELQKSTVLESQTLINPKDLQLTAANETILMENVEIFNKNGFHFVIDPHAVATKKVRLTKIPISKNCIFGKDDIDEMLYMLQEGCDTNCRPTRVRGMFASRACRKSVMVGKPLTFVDMRKLVDHMGEINQPWNCPHGRPTMRHLINLDLIDR